jgi:thiamine pyrophosphate-dependent acetolactate synthase large subunit-like protein
MASIDKSEFMQLVCELAERETNIVMANEQIYMTDENGDTSYTEEAQDIFNGLNDDFEAVLNHYGIHPVEPTESTKPEMLIKFAEDHGLEIVDIRLTRPFSTNT